MAYVTNRLQHANGGRDCFEIVSLPPFVAEIPKITFTEWKDLDVVPDWIKRDLILVVVHRCRIDNISPECGDVPHLLLHTDGTHGPRTFLMGTAPKLGLSEFRLIAHGTIIFIKLNNAIYMAMHLE